MPSANLSKLYNRNFYHVTLYKNINNLRRNTESYRLDYNR